MTPDYNTGEVPYTNQSNYNQRKRPERPLDPVSITVPGEAMTIQEIMERALGGMPIERENYGYFDQEDIDKISKSRIILTYASGAMDAKITFT